MSVSRKTFNSWNPVKPPASQSQNDVDYLKSFICPKCQRFYDVQMRANVFLGRVPLILPCEHTICEECVRLALKKSKEIACGECHSANVVENHDLKNKTVQQIFPVNFYVFGLLYYSKPYTYEAATHNTRAGGSMFHKSSRQFDNKHSTYYNHHPSFSLNTMKKALEATQECSQANCNRPAQVNCSDCDEVFCEICSDTLHKSARGLMKHKISSLNFFSSPELKEMCPTHKDNLLEFHCKTCEKNLCCYCVLGAHKEHEFFQVTNMPEQEIPEFKIQIQSAEEMLRKLQTAEKRVVHYLNANSSSTGGNSIDFSISRCFENLHGKLQVLEKQLRKEAADYKNINYNALMSMRSEVSSNVLTLTSLIQAAKHIVEGKQDAKLNVKIIQERLANALKIPCHLIRNKQSASNNIEFICGNLLNDLKDNFSIKSDTNRSYFLVMEEDLPVDYEVEGLSDTCSSVTSESCTTGSMPFGGGSLEKLLTGSIGFSSHKSNRSERVESWIRNVSEEKKVEMKMPSFRRGDRASVIVTHINSPQCFFVQLTSTETALNHLSRNIDVFVKNFAPTVAKPERNALYLVKYANDRRWCRGRIIDINEDETLFTVLFIDYGNTKKVKRQHINGISTELCEPCAFAKECKLFDLYPSKDEWDVYVIKLMAHIVAGNDLLMVVMDEVNGVLEVDILTIEGNTSVRDALMFIGHGIPHIKSPTELDTIKKSLKPTAPLKLYEKTIDYSSEKMTTVIITYVVDPHNIYINLYKNQRSLNELHDSMQKFYTENKKGYFVYSPKKDMVVAVSNADGGVPGWYRGIITDLTEGRGIVTVFLVDVGKTVSLSWNCIRKLGEQFIAVECQAILVKLADIKPLEDVGSWCENSIQYFDNFIKTRLSLKMVVSKVGKPVEGALFNCFPSVDRCLNAILVHDLLAESTGDLSKTIEWPRYESSTEEESEVSSENYTSNMMKTIQTSKQFPVDKKTEAASDEDLGNVLLRKPIEILSVVDPDLIYVKFVDRKQRFHEFNLEFQDYYSKQYFKISNDWNAGDMCVVYHEKQYHRAIVHKLLPETKFTVYLCDFGKYIDVHKKKLGLLIEKFQESPAFAIRCHLAGVLPAGGTKKWSALACEYLQEFFGNKDFYLAKQGDVDKQRKSMPVIIWYQELVPGGPLECSKTIYHNINKLLLDNGLALKIKKSNESKEEIKPVIVETVSEKKDKISKLMDWNEIMEEDFNQVEEPQEELSELLDWLPPLPFKSDLFDAKPTFVNDRGEIYLHDFDVDSVLQDMELQMNETFKSLPPESQNVVWFPGQLCSVRYFANNNWYRGKIISVDKEAIKVVMVDYGNEEECTAKDLTKKILYVDVPPFANKIVLHNVFPKNDKWQTSDLDLLHAQVVDAKVTVSLRNKNTLVPSAVVHLGSISINQFMLKNSPNLAMSPPKTKNARGGRQHVPEMNTADSDSEDVQGDVQIETVSPCDSDVIIEGEESAAEDTDEDDLQIYKHVRIPDGPTVQVAVINVIDFDKVILEIVDTKCDKGLFDAISKEMKDEASARPELEPVQIGAPCVAQFSEDDFGNFENVPSKSIRTIKPNWLGVPVEQHIALIHGIELADESRLDDVLEDMSSYFNTIMTAEIVSRSPLAIRLFKKDTNELAYQNLLDKGLLRLKEESVAV